MGTMKILPSGYAYVDGTNSTRAATNYNNASTLYTGYINDSIKSKDGKIRGYAWFYVPPKYRYKIISSVKSKGKYVKPFREWDDIDGWSTNPYWGTNDVIVSGVFGNEASNITYNNRNSIQNATTITNYTKSNTESGKEEFECDLTAFASEFYKYSYIRFDYTGHTFVSGSFGSGNVLSSSLELDIEYSDVVPVTTPIYPSNVNIESTKDVTFTWSYSATGSFGEVKQRDYVLQWSYDKSNWKFIADSSSKQYCVVPANTFEVGKTVYWRIRTCSMDDVFSGFSSIMQFNVIGATSAPVITNVTMDAKPTITWTVTSQSAYEMKITSNTSGKVEYQSGLVTTTSKSVKLEKMFAEDDYTVTMRVLNAFGYYTDWTSYHWVLEYTSVPTTPETPVVNVINGHFIQIITFNSLTAGKDKYWVVRTDEDGNEKVIDIHLDNNTVDTKCALNKTYYYKIRHYNEDASGFADSESIISYVAANGAIVNTVGSNAKAFHLWSNSDNKPFDIAKNDSSEKAFTRTIGRLYPVMECSLWETMERSFTAYVSDDDFKSLLDISRSGVGVYYRSDGEAFYASMEMSYKSRYIGGGVLVGFTFTRIDEDEVNLEV